MSQHDEIVAKIREALPEASARRYEWGETHFYVGSYFVFAVSSGVIRAGAVVLGRERLRDVHPDRLDDAITIARLWATLGEPR